MASWTGPACSFNTEKRSQSECWKDPHEQEKASGPTEAKSRPSPKVHLQPRDLSIPELDLRSINPYCVCGQMDLCRGIQGYELYSKIPTRFK